MWLDGGVEIELRLAIEEDQVETILESLEGCPDRCILIHLILVTFLPQFVRAT
jgi:hypothetical protein